MLRQGTLGSLALLAGVLATGGASTATRAAVAPAGADPVRFVVAPTGNEARYRVREQLAGMDLPNDAVGSTSEVTGAIVVDSTGRVIREESRFVVDLRNLKSDRDRRDRYLQRRTLVTDSFPTVVLVPTAIRGLAAPLRASGTRSFEVLGELTVRGVTRPTTWLVTAQLDGARISGTAATRFAFADFQLTQPRVASVLSVADTIQLEYDFRLFQEK